MLDIRQTACQATSLLQKFIKIQSKSLRFFRNATLLLCYASSSYLNGQMGLLRPQSSSILCSSFSLFEHAIVTSILWLAFFPSAMLQLYYTGRPFKPTVFEDKVFKTIFVNILQQLALSFLCRMCIDKLVKKSRNFFPINGYVMKARSILMQIFFPRFLVGWAIENSRVFFVLHTPILFCYKGLLFNMKCILRSISAA